MLALLAALVIPFGTAEASSARVVVRGTATPGSVITLVGTGFRASSYLQARWDVPAARLRFISVSRLGKFNVHVRIPAAAEPGMHTIYFGYVAASTVKRYQNTTRIAPVPTHRHVRVYVPPPGSPVGATVPASINATCASNVSSALNAWIAKQPNGSTLVFPSGSCYRLGGDAGLNLANRSGLTLEGTGSTLQVRTTGASNFSSGIFLQNSSHITIRGFAVDGGNTATGTTGARAAINEHKSGAVVRGGSSFIEFDHVSWNRIYGFGILISDDGRIGSWPSDISIHDSTIRGGEMGVAITAGRRIRIVGNAINDSVYFAVDMEPDRSSQGFVDVLISDNDVTRYAWGQTMTSWFVAACPADPVVGSVTMDGLTITGNRVHVGAATSNNGNFDGLGGLGIRADKSNLKRNVVITNNTTGDNDTQSSSRAVIYLAHVQNLTVTGNRQPIANGAAFVHDTGTTGTRVVSGNNLTP